jgi:hypothetical protein
MLSNAFTVAPPQAPAPLVALAARHHARVAAAGPHDPAARLLAAEKFGIFQKTFLGGREWGATKNQQTSPSASIKNEKSQMEAPGFTLAGGAI